MLCPPPYRCSSFSYLWLCIHQCTSETRGLYLPACFGSSILVYCVCYPSARPSRGEGAAVPVKQKGQMFPNAVRHHVAIVSWSVLIGEGLTRTWSRSAAWRAVSSSAALRTDCAAGGVTALLWGGGVWLTNCCSAVGARHSLAPSPSASVHLPQSASLLSRLECTLYYAHMHKWAVQKFPLSPRAYCIHTSSASQRSLAWIMKCIPSCLGVCFLCIYVMRQSFPFAVHCAPPLWTTVDSSSG